ncbi:putative holin-like toxin [Streptococcus respiraculi]
MSVYEALSFMIAFGDLIVASINRRDK